MKTMKHTALALAVLGAIGLSGCGSSSSSGSTGGTGARATTGVITGFGSVFVNGVEYETTGATFSLDDAAGSEDGLAIGMVVTVEGEVNSDGTTGTATSISFADDVEGLILSATLAADGTGTMNVMGQTVTITAGTRFESNVNSVTALAQLAAGNVVEVSGFSSGDGQIVATYIELKALAYTAGDDMEVKGTISNLDTTAKTFSLGDLVVYYNGADMSDIPSTGLANGLYVEAKSSDGFDLSNRLIASQVEVEGDGKAGIDADDGDDVELEGMVTAVTSATEFKLNAQSVRISESTEFEHGTADMIAVDVRLEVEGTMDGDVLVADKIEFRAEGDTEIFAPVEAFNATAGTVTVLGETITVTTLTEMKDERDEGYEPVRYFDLGDLAVDEWIKVKVYVQDGALYAAALERDDSGTVAQIEGTVDSVGTGTLTIDGIDINMSGVGTTFNVGDEVEIRGAMSGSVFVATDASLDD